MSLLSLLINLKAASFNKSMPFFKKIKEKSTVPKLWSRSVFIKQNNQH